MSEAVKIAADGGYVVQLLVMAIIALGGVIAYMFRHTQKLTEQVYTVATQATSTIEESNRLKESLNSRLEAVERSTEKCPK